MADQAKIDNELEIIQRFQEIEDKFKKSKLKPDRLLKLKSIERLTKGTSDKDRMLLYASVCLFVLAMFFGLLVRLDLMNTSGFATVVMTLQGYSENDTLSESCAVYTPDSWSELTRPVEDCSICRDLKEVERVMNMSPRQFEERHAYSGRPVVITDATANWTAHEAFTFEFFRSLYPEDSPLMNDECQFFPYKTEFESVNEVFNMSVERATLRDGSNPWYIGWSNCDQKATEKLRKHYSRPYFLPKDSESSKTDWIFMGSPGYGAHMHIDHVGQASWQAQIKGTKMWTLQPPPECYSECNTLEVTVNRGDIIVLDTNKWYHKTYVVGDDMSITIGSEYD